MDLGALRTIHTHREVLRHAHMHGHTVRCTMVCGSFIVQCVETRSHIHTQDRWALVPASHFLFLHEAIRSLLAGPLPAGCAGIPEAHHQGPQDGKVTLAIVPGAWRMRSDWQPWPFKNEHTGGWSSQVARWPYLSIIFRLFTLLLPFSAITWLCLIIVNTTSHLKLFVSYIWIIYILYDICFGKMMNNDDQINWFSVRLRYPLLPSGSGTRPATSGTTAGELVTAGGGAIWGCGMGR
jgi:hypothetical protein